MIVSFVYDAGYADFDETHNLTSATRLFAFRLWTGESVFRQNPCGFPHPLSGFRNKHYRLSFRFSTKIKFFHRLIVFERHAQQGNTDFDRKPENTLNHVPVAQNVNRRTPVTRVTPLTRVQERVGMSADHQVDVFYVFGNFHVRFETGMAQRYYNVHPFGLQPLRLGIYRRDFRQNFQVAHRRDELRRHGYKGIEKTKCTTVIDSYIPRPKLCFQTVFINVSSRVQNVNRFQSVGKQNIVLNLSIDKENV